MLYTNIDEHGGNFDDKLLKLTAESDNISIASGYVSLDIVEKYAEKFEDVARKGGVARLLVGMAFYEGLSQKKLTRLTNLSHYLSKMTDGSGVYVPYKRKYHGKMYRIESQGKVDHFIGSSNFSSSGLKGNMEATTKIHDSNSVLEIDHYFKYLFSEEVSQTIDRLEIIVPGSRGYKQKVSVQSLDELERYDPESLDKTVFPYFDLDLARLADKMKSSLNVYFGEGRLSRITGKITPRNWYETALIADATTIRNPLYPRGNFTAFTDDGYILNMSANGANNKNIQSRGNLRLFGMWMKTKLQKSGALVPLTPITLDTLDQYGRSSIRLYKISEGKYYMDFSVVESSDKIEV